MHAMKFVTFALLAIFLTLFILRGAYVLMESGPEEVSEAPELPYDPLNHNAN
jgi:hypothetical protein